jgi:hypothetical protein
MQNNLIKKLDNIQKILLQKDDNDVLIDMDRKIIVFPNVEYVTKNLTKINFDIFGNTNQALTEFLYHTKSSNQYPDNKGYIMLEKHSFKNGKSTTIQNIGISEFSQDLETIILYEKLVPYWNDNKDDYKDDIRQVYKNIMDSEGFKKAMENSKDAKGGNIRGHNTRGRNIRGGSTDIDIVPSDTVYNIIMNPNQKSNVNDSKLIKNYLEKLQKISKLNLMILYSNLSAKYQAFFLELSKEFCEIDLK